MQTDSVLYETFVKHTPYYHAEISGVRDGQAGDPLSYSIVSDDYVGIGFLLCLIVSALSVAKSWRFVCFQTKNLLRMPRANSFEMRETLNEMQYQAYFWLQGMAMYALLAYVVAKEYVAQEYVVDDYGLLGLFFAVIAIGFLLRYVVATIVHLVFFPKSERHMSSISRIYIIAVQGALMLPIMLLNVYYGLDVEKTLYVVVVVHVVTTLLRFYKIYRIFFKKNGRFLQFFLYLCTLEAVPFILMIGTMMFIANFLKYNI